MKRMQLTRNDTKNHVRIQKKMSGNENQTQRIFRSQIDTKARK